MLNCNEVNNFKNSVIFISGKLKKHNILYKRARQLYALAKVVRVLHDRGTQRKVKVDPKKI